MPTKYDIVCGLSHPSDFCKYHILISIKRIHLFSSAKQDHMEKLCDKQLFFSFHSKLKLPKFRIKRILRKKNIYELVVILVFFVVISRRDSFIASAKLNYIVELCDVWPLSD